MITYRIWDDFEQEFLSSKGKRRVYKNRKRANNFINKLNNEYGAYRYWVRPSYIDILTDAQKLYDHIV